MLRQSGHIVFNPAERDENEFGKFNSVAGDEFAFAQSVGLTPDQLRRHVFLEDTQWICRNADAIALLPDWERSKGALAEKALAEALELSIFYLVPVPIIRYRLSSVDYRRT